MSKTVLYPASDVCAAFGVGKMALYHWTAGTSTRNPLPCVKDATGRRLYTAAACRAYAKKYGLACNLPAQPSTFGPRGPAPGPIGVGGTKAAAAARRRAEAQQRRRKAAKVAERVVVKIKRMRKAVVEPSPCMESTAIALVRV